MLKILNFSFISKIALGQIIYLMVLDLYAHDLCKNAKNRIVILFLSETLCETAKAYIIKNRTSMIPSTTSLTKFFEYQERKWHVLPVIRLGMRRIAYAFWTGRMSIAVRVKYCKDSSLNRIIQKDVEGSPGDMSTNAACFISLSRRY